MSSQPLIRNISDTAAWVAMYRAWESERQDAVFRDPFARRLAGARGEQIMEKVSVAKKHAWSYVARTYLFDTYVAQEVAAGADMVVNLAAGLDTRPYRMQLPSSLQWIDVDLPDLLAYKQDILRSEKPVCKYESVALDLSNLSARRDLFASLGRRAKRVMAMSEGLIVYLTADEVCQLGKDLAAQPTLQRWATDLVSPGLLKMLQKQIGSPLREAGAPLKFAPENGPEFFVNCGWKPLDVRSMLHTAAKLKRAPFFLSLFAKFPDSKGAKPKQIWGGGVLLGRAD
ncbi:MAG TPA: SAM-dependent methyltransferase [Thermoanaerobaculia bacterium]|nr:SAM-dependent methyltransferase [Thermoanaerobaculia bacterium]